MTKNRSLLGTFAFLAVASLLFAGGRATDTAKKKAKEVLPVKFDLRPGGYVTPIRRQAGGTCWAHGAMAAIESNLLRSGVWKAIKGKGQPNLAEYHLDWWNGFNKHRNLDVKDAAKSKGLRVHVGGDYRVTAAYISRGDGVVYSAKANDGGRDLPWYKKAPKFRDPGYKRFYVRNIEWFTVGKDLANINTIKKRIMTEGAVGTAYCVSKRYLSKDFIHYQSPKSARDPNHAVAIVGWDDAKMTKHKSRYKSSKPPKPGAWLIKNSWGTKKGNKGYYWISYYDKHCCRHPEMGAVSFRNTEPLRYQQFYFHDYHGWRDTLKNISKAFNAFRATGRQKIAAVSFYTATDKVKYKVRVFRRFDNGQLLDERVSLSGTIRYSGMHTIDLPAPLMVQPEERFYVSLELSKGGQAIDRTSEIAVLLGRKSRKPIVISKARRGESYYFAGGRWNDLYDYKFENPSWGTFDRSANFCMKALAVDAPAVKTSPNSNGR